MQTQVNGFFNHDAQQCLRCLSTEYILKPNIDDCQKCPPGTHIQCIVVGGSVIGVGDGVSGGGGVAVASSPLAPPGSERIVDGDVDFGKGV